MSTTPGFWHDPLTLAIAPVLVGGGLALLKLLRRREATPHVENVANGAHQTGDTNIIAPGGIVTVTKVAATPARELAEQQLHAARQDRRAQERALSYMVACVTLAIEPLKNFLGNPDHPQVLGQVDSTLLEWKRRRPSPDAVEPELIEECETFFGDIEYHFVTIAFEGRPAHAKVESLLNDGEHLLLRINGHFPTT